MTHRSISVRGLAILTALGLVFALGASPAQAAHKKSHKVKLGTRCARAGLKRTSTGNVKAICRRGSRGLRWARQATAKPATPTTKVAGPATTSGPFKYVENGIDADSIKLGQTIAYSGPASAYGVIGKGISAYVKSVNAKGGVKMGDGRTRKIEFISYDDGYSPPKGVENAKRLVEEDKVFGLFNPLGTPINLAIWDYTNSKKVPQFMVASGASFWGRKIADHPFVTGFQPAYTTEASIYAEYLKETKPAAKIAVLYQNDDYGKDYYNQFEQSIKGSGLKLVGEQSYEVTDATVDQQVTTLARSGADTFFNITTPKFAAQAIAKMDQLGWKPLHILNSVAASVESVLRPAEGCKAGESCAFARSQGIITASWAKDPSDPQWSNDKGMQDYFTWVKDHGGDLDPKNTFTAYGYTLSQALVKVLEQMKEPSRAGLMQSLRSMDFELPTLLPGMKVKMDGPRDTYPLESMQLAKFTNDRFVLQGKVISFEGKTPKA